MSHLMGSSQTRPRLADATLHLVAVGNINYRRKTCSSKYDRMFNKPSYANLMSTLLVEWA